MLLGFVSSLPNFILKVQTGDPYKCVQALSSKHAFPNKNNCMTWRTIKLSEDKEEQEDQVIIIAQLFL